MAKHLNVIRMPVHTNWRHITRQRQIWTTTSLTVMTIHFSATNGVSKVMVGSQDPRDKMYTYLRGGEILDLTPDL